MKVLSLILKCGKGVVAWITRRWEAIVSPEEAKTGKKIKNLKELVDVADSVKKSNQQTIEWKKQQYSDLGLTKKEVRDRLLPQIDKDEDNLSVMQRLAKDREVYDIPEEPNRRGSQPMLPSSDV